MLLFFLLLSLTIFSNDLYTNALNAYLEGDYRRALRLFEESLQKDPTIEERDPLVKLKMGICAYAIGDYEKARAYLSNFPDNVIAREILNRLNVPQEEWEKYVRSKAPSGKSKTTETSKGFPTWLSIVVSGGTFLAVFLLQRLLIKRITRTPETAKEAGKTLEEPEAIPEEIPALEEKKEADERLDVLEELLGRIQEENTGEESLDVEEALKKAREIYERSEEVPDDLTAEEANLDVEETLKELEAKEEYTEEDARKLVLALKKKLREE
ncbi:tetratricopeptide repeat protein [Thermotoga neapolitana]|jgi:tetratricopeptide (TPR) repeat protein|nr:tetratricopeptide repeat protein [Thermotoga neapolitana]MDK2785601.1 hypothetical protein [Thermotoga sp.]